MEKLVNIFNEVKSFYFPRWDIKKEWTIKVRTRIPSERGFCDPSNKAICVYPLWAEEGAGDLYALIIHEICHAVASHWHGKKLQARLLKAADKAQDIGETDLADKILADVKLSQEPAWPSNANFIYHQITDALIDAPDASMDAVFAWVASDHGYTVEKLLKRCPRAERVYNQAKEDVMAFNDSMALHKERR